MRMTFRRHGFKALVAAVIALVAVLGTGTAHALPPFTWSFVGFGQTFCIVNNATPKQVDFRVSPYGTWTAPLSIRVEVDIPGATYETLAPIPPRSNVAPRDIEETITIFIPPNFPNPDPNGDSRDGYTIRTYGRDQLGEQLLAYDPDGNPRRDAIIVRSSSCDPDGG
jgi:hypothetical protein